MVGTFLILPSKMFGLFSLSEIQDGHCHCRKLELDSMGKIFLYHSSLKPLNHMQPNTAEILHVWYFTRRAYFVSIINSKWSPTQHLFLTYFYLEK